MSQSGSRATCTVGMVVFAVGLLLLLLVFWLSFQMFTAYTAHPERAVGDAVQQSAVAGGIRLVALFVMGYVASLLATKGLQLYGVCKGVSPG